MANALLNIEDFSLDSTSCISLYPEIKVTEAKALIEAEKLYLCSFCISITKLEESKKHTVVFYWNMSASSVGIIGETGSQTCNCNNWSCLSEELGW